MNKKSKIILGSSLAAGTALVGGAFALFSDSVDVDLFSKAGTVQVEADAILNHYQLKRDELAKLLHDSQPVPESMEAPPLTPEEVEAKREEYKNMFEVAPDNLNPGDNEYIWWDSSEEMPRPGTDHEIEVNIKNTGNKSIKTRVIVEITGITTSPLPEEGPRAAAPTERPLTTEELSGVRVYLDKSNTISGLSSLHLNDYDDLVRLKRVGLNGDYEENKISYGIDSSWLSYEGYWDESDSYPECQPIPEIIKSNLLLSGTGEDAEIEKYAYEVYNEETDEFDLKTAECSSEGSFKLDLGMSDYAEDSLQGAKLNVKVKVQAMQYRNTSNTTWEDIFEEDFIIDK